METFDQFEALVGLITLATITGSIVFALISLAYARGIQDTLPEIVAEDPTPLKFQGVETHTAPMDVIEVMGYLSPYTDAIAIIHSNDEYVDDSSNQASHQAVPKHRRNDQ